MVIVVLQMPLVSNRHFEMSACRYLISHLSIMDGGPSVDGRTIGEDSLCGQQGMGGGQQGESFRSRWYNILSKPPPCPLSPPHLLWFSTSRNCPLANNGTCRSLISESPAWKYHISDLSTMEAGPAGYIRPNEPPTGSAGPKTLQTSFQA